MSSIKNKLKFLEQLSNKGLFPNDHYRIWTMCQTALEIVKLTVEEAEKYKMTDEQYYLDFEDKLNALSVKDHSNNADSGN